MRDTFREEKGQTIEEILFSGRSCKYVKTFRSLLNYVTTIVSESSSGDVIPADNLKSQRANCTHDENDICNTTGTVGELRMRDLRLLDYHFNPDEIHTIIVRKNCVVLSLDPFRAVITSDRIIIVTPSQVSAEHNMDQILKIFQKNFYGTRYYMI